MSFKLSLVLSLLKLVWNISRCFNLSFLVNLLFEVNDLSLASSGRLDDGPVVSVLQIVIKVFGYAENYLRGRMGVE